MRIELAPENFDHGVGDFDIGHVLRTPKAQKLRLSSLRATQR